MDSKINLPSRTKRVPRGNSVIDEINRGKEYSKLLEQRQYAAPVSSIAAGHKDKTQSVEATVKVETKSEPVKQSGKGNSAQSVTAMPDAVGQIAIQSKSDTVKQNAKVNSAQAVTGNADTKSGTLKQDDKGKSKQIVPAKPDPIGVGQVAVQTKPDPLTQGDKTKPGQIDQNIKTASEETAEKPIELCQQLYPDVYVERTIVPEYQPNYDEIPRAPRNIINRDTLTLNEHMNLLAQPKVVKQRQVEPPYVVRRKVPGPSPRIIQLARPKRRQTLETCNRFGATMEQFCIENCHRNVQDVTFVPVHDAVYFIELNKRRPLIEQEKLKLRMQRLQEKINEAKMAKTQDVLRTLYSSLKSYLQPPPLIPTEKPADCAECAKGSSQCDDCAKIEAQIDDDDSDDDDTDDQQVDGVDTEKLSSVLRCKMEKLLNHQDEIKEGSHLDLLLVWISKKLAIWMKKLQKAELIEEVDKVTEDVVSSEVKTDAAQNVDATVTK